MDKNRAHIAEIGGVIKKVREWPKEGGGSLTFAQFIREEELDRLKEQILAVLYKSGYRGQYDIEFLVCEDRIYLNEINFRHSGNGYGLIENGVYAPYIWCLDCAGIPIPDQLRKSVPAGVYHMDEMNDFSHRRGNNVSVGQWICDIMRTSAFSVFSWRDLSGTWGFYRVKCRRGIKKIVKRLRRTP